MVHHPPRLVTSGLEWPMISGQGGWKVKRQESSVCSEPQHLPFDKKKNPRTPPLITPNILPNRVLLLPNIFTRTHNSPNVRRISISRKCQFQRVSFHPLQPKTLQGLCRWRGEGRKNRLRNEAASQRKLDLFHATHNTLALQISSSPRQGCTDGGQISFFKGQTSEYDLSLCPSLCHSLTWRVQVLQVSCFSQVLQNRIYARLHFSLQVITQILELGRSLFSFLAIVCFCL